MLCLRGRGGVDGRVRLQMGKNDGAGQSCNVLFQQPEFVCVWGGVQEAALHRERAEKPQTSSKDEAVLGPHEESHTRSTKQERLSEAMSGAFIREERIYRLLFQLKGCEALCL